MSLTQRDGLLVGRLACGMACWCFALDACLVVVVAGSGDILRAGSFPCARHVDETASSLRCTVWWTREPVRSHHRASAARQRLGQEVQCLMADGVWGGTFLDEYALRAPDAALPVAGGPHSVEDQDNASARRRGNFHDEDLSFDRNSVDDRPATVSHAMAEVLDRMPHISKCERHVQ